MRDQPTLGWSLSTHDTTTTTTTAPQEEETEHSTGYCAQSASLCIVPMYTATDRDLRTPLLTFVVQEEAVGWNGAVLIQYATYTPSDPPTLLLINPFPPHLVCTHHQ